jgi:exodeoxyribonuclease VII large subunit
MEIPSDPFAAAPPAERVLSVSALNARVRGLVERGLGLAWVGGEISNFTRATSGHCYFTLKDDAAQVRCVMFRGRAQLLDWQPANGAQVEVRATASFYEPRGEFQLSVEFMRRAGLGALYEAFERLKRKLAAEGLFDPARKRALPAFPRTVGVITSPRAAALRDVLTTLRRRMPSLRVILYPAPVQGEGAAVQLAAALAAAGAHGLADVLILCRGGGSIEDLQAFNDEALARAVAASPVPVVTGVGHETDFTIVDFVADARAPTPTAAAELVSPDAAALGRRLEALARALRARWREGQDRRLQRLDIAQRRLRHPAERIARQREQLAQARRRLALAGARVLESRALRLGHAAHRLARARPRTDRAAATLAAMRESMQRALRSALRERALRVEALGAQLGQLNPEAVLGRGYAIVRDARGAIVTDAAALCAGEPIEVKVAAGAVAARVEAVRGD